MAIFFNEEFLSHMQSPFHPESPERLRGIMQKLREHGLWKDVIPSRSGRLDNLLLVHDEGYIDFIKTCGECSITLDTMVHHETYGIASLAAQCAVDAVDYSKKNGKPSFALTRPPGHHAGKDYGMGFCYFNNISIAAKHLLWTSITGTGLRRYSPRTRRCSTYRLTSRESSPGPVPWNT